MIVLPLAAVFLSQNRPHYEYRTGVAIPRREIPLYGPYHLAVVTASAGENA
jgi:hypothetical protein